MREQSSLDFASKVPNAFSRRGPVQARHASRKGAEDAANRAENQTARLIALYQQYPDGLTDWRAAELLGIERTSVNARRSPLVKAGVVVANGFVKDEHSDVANTRWQLAAMRNGSIGGGTCAKDAARHHGNDAEPARTECAREVVTAGETAATSNRGTGQPGHRETSGASVTEYVAMLPSAPLSSETVKTLAYNTPVRLADGRRAHYKMLMKSGDLACVIDAREPVYLKPSRLIDRRATDGELVEILS
jgi:hypothetical protein